MKKVLLSAACAVAFSANAGVAEEVVVAETAQPAFSSVYAGLGIGGSFLKSDDITYATEAEVASGKFKSKKTANLTPKANRFIGSFVLGAGKVFKNNVYAGAEFMMDFTKNKKLEFTGKGNAGTKAAPVVGDLKGEVKIGGFIPQINVKAGYVFKNNTLAYAKLGCAWTKVSSNFVVTKGTNKNEVSHSKTKASFVLGLGAEKAFCKKFSAALEGDYNFGWKENGVRFNKGWNVRALVKYNVKY